MPRFQEQKKRFATLFGQENWQAALDSAIADASQAKIAVNALLALLNRPEFRWQAAYALGICLRLIADETMEQARIFMRRLMWSLNEESGNLGWGVPEAMGCILAASPALAGEYGRIFISYGYETGKDDNFLDHGPLRRGVYWGIGWLARSNPERARPALPHLVRALADEDVIICAFSAWALEQLSLAVQELAPEEGGAGEWDEAAEALTREIDRRERAGRSATAVELFDGRRIREEALGSILRSALRQCTLLQGGSESQGGLTL